MPPHCPQGHGQPQGANQIDPRYSADALKAVSDLQLGSCPQAILKVRQPSSLVYRPRHGVLPKLLQIFKKSHRRFLFKARNLILKILALI